MPSKIKGRAGCNQATLSTTDLRHQYISGTAAETGKSLAAVQAQTDLRQCFGSDGVFGFLEAIRLAGLEPPSALEPGRIQRFPGMGKRSGNRAGWCILFEDGQAGCFGDWSSGIEGTWRADRARPFSPKEQAAFAKRAREARRTASQARRTRQLEAAERAARIWRSAVPASADHSYLLRKKVRPHGARAHGAALCLPVTDFYGNLHSLQFISATGRKRLLSGGRKGGCFIPVSKVSSELARAIICEGWATGCTLAEDDPNAVVLAAIDAGNLHDVAVAARHRWRSAELVIAGDDDRLTPGNPGAKKARQAAIAADALLALPQWPDGAPEHLSDFNDLALWLAGGGA